MGKWGEIRSNVAFAGRWVWYLLFGAWPAFASVGLILICGGVALLFGVSEPSVRITGLLLQVIGFLTTMINLIGIGNAFGATLWAKLTGYFQGIPKRNHHASISGSASMVEFDDVVVATGHSNNASIADRLASLEQATERTRSDIASIRGEAKAKEKEASSRLAELATTLQSEIATVRKLVNDAMTGSLSLQWVGVTYFVIGIGLGTASPEIACFLGNAAACR